MRQTGPFADPATRASLAVCALGVAILAIGITIPAYTDFQAASQLKVDACIDTKPIDGWFEQMAALKTMRLPVMQSGASLVLASLTWLGLLRTFPGESRFVPRTPGRIAAFFLLGLGVIGTSWAANIYSVVLDFDRGEFPWCADSIIIPISGLTFAYLILTTLALIIGGLIATLFGSLPVELASWDHERQVKSWIVTLLLAMPFAMIFGATLLDAGASTFLAVPAGVVALYLVASTRVALLSDGPGKENGSVEG